MPRQTADPFEMVRRKARAIVRASGMRRPPFSPERYASRCHVSAIVAGSTEGAPVRVETRAGAGERVIVVDRGFPPHTPQWNGAVALGLAETFAPAGAAGEARQALTEAAAAELLLPMAVFRPAALRTDLTLDGLRDLAARFAAPIRLTARQWLSSGAWRGFALLWREEDGGELRLRWRAASTGRFPPALALGASAARVWGADSRLFATHRTGRPHHGVEEVRLNGGAAWWFTRFGIVREHGAHGPGPASNAVLAMVLLDRRQGVAAPGEPAA